MKKVKVLILNNWRVGNLISHAGIIKLMEIKNSKSEKQVNEEYLLQVEDEVSFRADPDLIYMASNWPSTINVDFRIVEIELPDGISIDDPNLEFKDTEHINPSEELVYEFPYDKIVDYEASY